MAVTPYVVGQWVREERFYGRRALLEEILEGGRDAIWILGTRRVGKTSILKQLEHITTTATAPRYFPLFWDFQGSETEDDLHEGFRDALFDTAGRLDSLGIDIDEVDDPDLFTVLGRLRRTLRQRKLSLLLLGDEVEELVGIHQHAPRFLRRLQRALQSHEGIRTVLASTIRLWRLTADEAASAPFLAGFTPPLAVRGLSDGAAHALVRQDQLPAASRPRIDDATVEVICRRSNRHPYLLQLLAERYLELGDLEEATHAIASDPMVSFFFDADLQMLTDAERRILRVIDHHDGADSNTIRDQLAVASPLADSGVKRLEHLGFLERHENGGYSLANDFFRRWFASQSHSSRERRDNLDDRPTVAAATGKSPGPGSGVEREPTVADNRLGDRYELLGRLGSGATGDVWKARDTLLRTIVAVKILKPEYGADEEAIERLRREVVLTRDLSHPNILKIYHLGDDAGRKYITMQFVDGPDLAEVIAAEAPIAPDRAIVIAAKLAAALATLHRSKVLHRDVKPSNVLIDDGGEPRITDFGLARLQESPGLTQHGMFLGTPAYASPEQATGKRLDERADLYALGIVLFEMLTGRTPFIAQGVHEQLVMRLRTEPPKAKDILPSIPQPLSDLTHRCLARERDERIQSAAELYRALVALRKA